MNRFGPAFRARVATAVREAVGRGEFPGAVVLVDVHGRIVLHAAFGHASLQPRRAPMCRDTVFDLASLTKPLATGLALVRLAADGVLSLRDPVRRFLPAFTGGGKDDVTLLDLATHTGGLDDAGLYDPRRPMETTADILALLWSKALFAPPRTAYRYADFNYIALGLAVAAAAGKPLDAWFAERVARPLGLRTARFRPGPALAARCAATQRIGGRVLRGTVHDPRAALLGGVAGHAGLFADAADVRTVARMLLDGGRARGRRFLPPAAAAAMTSVHSPAGLRPRMVGWDSDPDGFGPRGDLFPAGGFGHTGFTGTSVWADPGSDTVVVLLTNRVHPDGGGNADPCRRRLANLVAAEARTAGSRRAAPPVRVATGLDALAEGGFAALKGRRIGLVTNLAVLDRSGVPAVEVLARAPGTTLAAVFTPEHGLAADLDERVRAQARPGLAVPVYSLYGDSLRPSAEQLAGVDLLVIDLPDVGTRFYTYHATAVYALEAAAARGLDVLLLDRPNPLTGLLAEGPVLARERFGFTGEATVPVRHGLTLGELVRLAAAARGFGDRLRVEPVRGWRRALWFDETGLPWANPSPNLRSLTQAILYPAVGLLEACNVSVGRGTDAPFERLGAPWLDGAGLAADLNARRLPGLRAYPASFTPAAREFAGERCGGVALQLTDRDAFRPVLTGLTIAERLLRRHPGEFRAEGLDALLADPTSREALEGGTPAASVAAGWEPAVRAYERDRSPFLLY